MRRAGGRGLLPWSGRMWDSGAWWAARSTGPQTQETRLSCLLSEGTVPPVTAHMAAGPRDARDAECRCRLPRNSTGAEDVCCRRYRWPSRKRWVDLTAFAGSDGYAREQRLRAVERLSTQIVDSTWRKYIVSTAEQRDCNAVINACQEYEELPELATANLGRRCTKLELAHPPQFENGANSLEIHNSRLLKSGASRQEKASVCNGNGAAANEHF